MYRLIWLVCLGLICVPVVGADEQESTLSKLNPFASGDDAPSAKASTGDNETGGFAWPSMPKLPSLPKPSLPKFSLPSLGSATATSTARTKPNEPSMWEKMNGTTKNLYSKTKQTLMPWADDSSTARTSSGTTRRPARTSSRSKSKSSKKSFFSSWFSSQDEERPIRNVNDYLAQPRVPIE